MAMAQEAATRTVISLVVVAKAGTVPVATSKAAAEATRAVMAQWTAAPRTTAITEAPVPARITVAMAREAVPGRLDQVTSTVSSRVAATATATWITIETDKQL